MSNENRLPPPHCRFYGSPHFSNVSFYCHGILGSAREAALLHEEAMRLGISIVSVTRPGYAERPRNEARTLMDWGSEIASLADGLEVERFSIVGISAGVPYCLAAAAALKTRVTHAIALSGPHPPIAPDSTEGMAPLLRFGFIDAHRGGSLTRPLLAIASPLARMFPQLFVDCVTAMNSRVDKKALSRDGFLAAFRKSMRDGLRQGLVGGIDDLRLISAPWGIPYDEITAKVHLWHGTRDHVTPIAMGRMIAHMLPGARFQEMKGGGHFAAITHQRAILTALVEQES